MREFTQTQNKKQAQKKVKNTKTAVAPKVAAPISTYKPKGVQPSKTRSEEGFETVGVSKQSKRRYSDSYDSESDEAQTPNNLLIKLDPNRQDLSQSLINALETVPEASKTSILTDNIKAVEELLTTKNCTMRGGWEHPHELSLLCLYVGRE